MLNRLLIPRFGSHLAASITRADIAGIHADYGKSHPYGANRFICVVRKMFIVGRQLGMIPEEMRNPGTEIQRFPEHKRRRYVTPAEIPRLAAAINDDPNEFAGHALWLLLLTGVRRNEILAAKWADVDWDNKTLYIGKTKNGEAVLTPLSRAAIARLKLCLLYTSDQRRSRYGMTMRDHCPKAKQRGCRNVNTELWYVPFKKSLNELLPPCEAVIIRSRQKR